MTRQPCPCPACRSEARVDLLCRRYLDALEAGDARRAREIRTTAGPRGRRAIEGLLDSLIDERRCGS